MEYVRNTWTEKQMNSQRQRQTGRQAGRQAGRQTDRHASVQAGIGDTLVRLGTDAAAQIASGRIPLVSTFHECSERQRETERDKTAPGSDSS